MGSEMPSFSDEQGEEVSQLPGTEVIIALIQEEIQALKQVEKVSRHLFQALEQQNGEVETFIMRMKGQKNISKSLIRFWQEQYVWHGLAGEIEGYETQCENYRSRLECVRETYQERLAAFRQLQEDVAIFYPQEEG